MPILVDVAGISAPNYEFTAVNGTLTILPRRPPPPPIVQVSVPTTAGETAPVAVDMGPVTGGVFSASPNLSVAGLDATAARANPQTGAITVDLVQQASTAISGVVIMAVPKEVLTREGGFTFKLPEQMVEGQAPGATIAAALADGMPLPAWLRFNADTRTFVASAVPEGALPREIAIFVNGTRTGMTIGVK